MAECNPWPAVWSGCGGEDPEGHPRCEPLASMTPEEVAFFVTMASDFLRQWTAGRYGTCPVTIRPCRQECHEGRSSFLGGGPGGSGGFTPVLIGGDWYNITCGVCGDRCGCGDTVPALRLPGPVHSVERVVIGREVLPADAYAVDNSGLLLRLDGQPWPACQDMSAPSAPAEPLVTGIVPDAGPPEGGGTVTVSGAGFLEPDPDDPAPLTFEVTYLRGLDVPHGGRVAAGVLACELAKDACGDRSCRLPRRVSSVDRQGVSIVDFSALDKGQTGIWLIDHWLSSVTDAPQRARVLSPDRPGTRGRTRTWP